MGWEIGEVRVEVFCLEQVIHWWEKCVDSIRRVTRSEEFSRERTCL